MQPERLESSAENLDRKARRAKRREERQLRRRTRRNERRTKRIAPYTELAKRNKNIVERAKVIAEAGHEEGDKQPSNLIVLGLTRETDDSSKKSRRQEKRDIRKNVRVQTKNNIIVRVTKFVTDESRDEDRAREHVEFTFFAVDNKTLSKIQAQPNTFKINPQGWADNADELAIESTFRAKSGGDSVDQLVGIGSRQSPERVVNPIGAIDRALEIHKRTSQVDELGSTMDMIEGVINNPQLNPVLSQHLAGRTGQGPQTATP